MSYRFWSNFPEQTFDTIPFVKPVRMNETTPLLKDGNSAVQPVTKDSSCAKRDESSSSSSKVDVETVETATTSVPTVTTTTSEPIPGNDTTGVVNTKQPNIPILELLALTAIISGSLSMYWGISGMMLVGTSTAAATISVIATTLLSQPIIFVHIIMSTCVVVLAPVVTVQKVQLSALGTLREQQNELRTQINSFNQMNDELTKSIESVVDETEKIEQVNNELEVFAKSAGTSAERLVELCNEQNDIHTQLQKHLQAKILQQIVTITLQSDMNQNYIVSENEVNVLIERLQHIPGMVFHVDTFRHILNQSEPKGSLTLTDICSIARNMQLNASNTTTAVADESNIELTQYGDPVFVFQPNDVLLPVVPK